MTAEQELMAELLREVPELEELYREHEATYHEVLGHVLMGDITRLALELAGESCAPWAYETSTLARLLRVLDRGMLSASASVQELIAVSFLENLDESQPNYHALTGLLGSALVHEMTRLHGGDPW